MSQASILVIGANSQDAYVLSEILVGSGDFVVATTLNAKVSKPLHSKLFPQNIIIETAEYNSDFFVKVLSDFQFKQIYIFGSISIVNDHRLSKSEYFKSTIHLVESLTEALMRTKKINSVVIFHSSSVEMFGKDLLTEQTESTPFNPQSFYAEGKTLAHMHLKNLREKGDCKSINGILYNHESKYRKIDFVTQKICQGVAEIFLGKRKKIILGNLNSYRDWSYANDLIAAAKFGMDNDLIDDYILASGTTRGIEEWISNAFNSIGIKDWKKYIELDSELLRSGQEYIPKANVTKARSTLNLKQSISFESLVDNMVIHKINGGTSDAS
jgi:GDPmannose 4,6-dehydratase